MQTAAIDSVAVRAADIRSNIERVIVGAGEVIELALTAVLSDGHLLLEDVPGVGKTMLARSIARSLGCTFRRVQCTPDLLPSDITGSHVFNMKTQEFEFRQGPVFAQVVLADEINRASPRTQSALLEAMEERQVSSDGETMPLPRPFLVLATQNPVELEGTFPLPEAQLDRFLMRVKIGYPSEADDALILDRFALNNPLEELEAVADADVVLRLQQGIRTVKVSDAVRDYVIRLVRATRAHGDVELGASPRAMQALYRASQALAAIRDRDFVLPDDVKHLAPFVFEHRLVLTPQAQIRGEAVSKVLAEIVASVEVPVEEQAGNA